MKYQGKTIHKNKNAETWYTRYRINGKQYYMIIFDGQVQLAEPVY